MHKLKEERAKIRTASSTLLVMLISELNRDNAD